jgi:hypothetical protein
MRDAGCSWCWFGSVAGRHVMQCALWDSRPCGQDQHQFLRMCVWYFSNSLICAGIIEVLCHALRALLHTVLYYLVLYLTPLRTEPGKTRCPIAAGTYVT